MTQAATRTRTVVGGWERHGDVLLLEHIPSLHLFLGHMEPRATDWSQPAWGRSYA